MAEPTIIDGNVQYFASATQEKTDECKKNGTHKLKYNDFLGREFMLCPTCFYSEDVE